MMEIKSMKSVGWISLLVRWSSFEVLGEACHQLQSLPQQTTLSPTHVHITVMLFMLCGLWNELLKT